MSLGPAEKGHSPFPSSERAVYGFSQHLASYLCIGEFVECCHATTLWGEPARMRYTCTCTQLRSSGYGSEVDAIMGVGKCRRVGVYGRYCGCTSS